MLGWLLALAILTVVPVAAAPAASASTARSPTGAFRWLVAQPAPPGWPQVETPTTGATLSYPPSFAPVSSDAGSVSAAVPGPDRGYVAFLNATPRQGAERSPGFAAFRVRLLGREHGEAVHEEAAAEHVRFRGGLGSCVIDAYVTRIGHRRYREIACLVVGSHASTVVVATALTTRWNQFRPLLQQSLAAFSVT